MKKLIALEELGMMVLSLLFLMDNSAAWWLYLLLFIGPDISMLGYLGGRKAGAVSYNLFHHKALAIALFLVGILSTSLPLQLAGAIVFGHSAMDRTLGYGLKHFTGFKYTHLGIIGKK